MKRERHSIRYVAAWVILAASIVLLADRPDVRRDPPGDAGVSPVLAAGGKEKEGAKHAAGNEEEKWQEVEAFMKANSSHKLEAYKKLPEPAQAQLRAQLIAMYNEVNRLSNNKPLHELEVQRIQIEDEIFAALLSERKRARAPADQLSKETLAAVRRLVENRMKEREIRLSNLKTSVTILQAQVNKDENLRNDAAAMNQHVKLRAQSIERNGLGSTAAGGRRRGASGQPATAESEDEVIPANP